MGHNIPSHSGAIQCQDAHTDTGEGPNSENQPRIEKVLSAMEQVEPGPPPKD